MCEEVETSIAKVLNNSTSESRDIMLDEPMLNKVCRGGFHQISGALVGGSVILDVVISPQTGHYQWLRQRLRDRIEYSMWRSRANAVDEGNRSA